MSVEEAVKYFGSAYKLCKALDIKDQNYTHWRRTNKIPLIQQLRLEKLTNGQLKADEENNNA